MCGFPVRPIALHFVRSAFSYLRQQRASLQDARCGQRLSCWLLLLLLLLLILPPSGRCLLLLLLLLLQRRGYGGEVRLCTHIRCLQSQSQTRA